VEDCPGAPNCRGPGGTQISFPRLYGFNVWNTRTYLRESLKAVFPDQASHIDKVVDPGEYGLESYNCRIVCCFIFMLGVLEDLRITLNLCFHLGHLPSRPDKWIRYEEPTWGSKDFAKSVHGWCELHMVKFGVAGMPMMWKIANVCLVVLPKLLLWILLVFSGFHFLMETAGIVNVIMNSMALTFILGLDELVFDVLTSAPVKHMMGNLEEFPLFSYDELEADSDDSLLKRYNETEISRDWKKVLTTFFPRRLLVVSIMLPIFIFKYYIMNCNLESDGSRVSKPLYTPFEMKFNPLTSFIPEAVFTTGTLSWNMPE